MRPFVRMSFFAGVRREDRLALGFGGFGKFRDYARGATREQTPAEEGLFFVHDRADAKDRDALVYHPVDGRTRSANSCRTTFGLVR